MTMFSKRMLLTKAENVLTKVDVCSETESQTTCNSCAMHITTAELAMMRMTWGYPLYK